MKIQKFDEFILESTDLSIAKDIKEQIGHKAFYMMGAWNLVAHENGLSFRIKGSSKYNYIKVEVTGMDLFNVTFMKLGKDKIIRQEKVEGIYNDMLHKTIETNTGLYLSL